MSNFFQKIFAATLPIVLVYCLLDTSWVIASFQSYASGYYRRLVAGVMARSELIGWAPEKVVSSVKLIKSGLLRDYLKAIEPDHR